MRHDSLGTRSGGRGLPARVLGCTAVSRTGTFRAEIANAVLGGWHRYLDLLEQSLSGTPDLDTMEPDYAQLHVPGRPGTMT